METISVAGLPFDLAWDGPVPLSVTSLEDGIILTAPPKSDLFRDPSSDQNTLNSPRLLFKPDDEFTLSARVTVDFKATFDAGVLLIFVSESSWAKLCFEYSPNGEAMIVSVVTNGRSDDANSVVIDGDTIFLRIATHGQGFAFHYSKDGALWNLVRHFALSDRNGSRIGISPQSPIGDGCTATFRGIGYRAEGIKEIRSGE